MKICLVSRGDLSFSPPTQGASVKLYHTIKSLSELGNVVYFVTSEQDKYFEIKNGVWLKKKYPIWVKKIPTSKKIIYSLLLMLGVPREELVLFSPAFDFKLWLKTFYVSTKENADIMQAEFPAFAAPAVFTKFFTNKPVSLVEHNVEYFRINETYKDSKNFFVKFLETRFCNLSDIVMVVSEVDKKRLVKMGVDKNKIHVIPHGVDLDEYKKSIGRGSLVRKKYGIKNSEVVMIFHGTLCYKPNFDAVKNILEKILPDLDKEKLNYKMLIVGPYPPDIKHPRLIFTGAVKNLSDYIDTADIAIVPIKHGGGARMKILEYFAAKKPVISTKKGIEGIPVMNGEEICISEIDEFAKNIIKILRFKKIREKIIKNAYDFVKNYDWSEIGKKYVELYKTLKN